jgi:hypothetical protein
MFKLKKQPYNSVLISCDSQEILADSFMRFQEHYESPYWADKVFTIGQFKKWYSENRGGDTYRHDWRGFNFPSYVLKPFKEGLFDPLTENEKLILDLVRYRNDNFYVVGSNDDKVLKHELNHALFNFSEEYRTEIIKIIDKNNNKLREASNYLIKLGYHKKVIYDELQAYILDDDAFFEAKEIEIPNLVKQNIFKLNKEFSKRHKNNN